MEFPTGAGEQIELDSVSRMRAVSRIARLAAFCR
jgi:hypothetical protein